MPKKEDRRVTKTKKQLRLALAQLLKDNKMSAITIRQLTELADINRGTFYLHYEDLPDFFSHVQEDCLRDISDILDQHSPRKMKTNIYPMLLEVFKYIACNKEICTIAFGSDAKSGMIQQFKILFREKSFSDWDTVFPAADKEKYELFFHFMSSGFIGIVQYWIANDYAEKPSEIALMTTNLFSGSVHFLSQNMDTKTSVEP